MNVLRRVPGTLLSALSALTEVLVVPRNALITVHENLVVDPAMTWYAVEVSAPVCFDSMLRTQDFVLVLAA